MHVVEFTSMGEISGSTRINVASLTQHMLSNKQAKLIEPCFTISKVVGWIILKSQHFSLTKRELLCTPSDFLGPLVYIYTIK